MKQLTAERLRAALFYDPIAGTFVRIGSRNANRWCGKKAGWVTPYGYQAISISGNCYLAHRLAWLYMKGCWPAQFIDHIDGNKLNNVFSNLREADMSHNVANTTKRTHNTSGFKGVFAQNGKWKAYIKKDYVGRHLGMFPTRELAAEAYAKAAKELFGEFANND